MKRLLLLILCALPLCAESPHHKLFRWSLAALASGNALDAASSWGRPEQNPLLGQRFGARSTAIKFGITGAVVLAERFYVRRHAGFEKPFSVVNFASGAALTGVAVRNWRVR